LRTSAFAAALAGIVGVLVAPGVRGNTGEPTVIVVDWASATLDAFLMGALMALWLDATLELMRTHEIPVAVRIALSGGGAATAALAAMALLEHEHPPAALSLLIASAASVVALAGATSAITAPHTRAVAGVLLAFAFASIARLAAWEMATHAGETANLALFGWSRVFATVGVMLEACGQMIAVVWLSSRGRWAGQLGLSLALFGAVGLTYAVAQGMHSGAALWQAIIHSSLADAPGIPRPYRLDAFAIFLVSSSLLLALVAAAQPNQVAALVAAMALALVSRGAFDAPLRALCAVVAAQWATLAALDGRAMWRTLIDDRTRRLVD
jgi:hypothetical protein